MKNAIKDMSKIKLFTTYYKVYILEQGNFIEELEFTSKPFSYFDKPSDFWIMSKRGFPDSLHDMGVQHQTYNKHLLFDNEEDAETYKATTKC